jgi:hypothetical protein
MPDMTNKTAPKAKPSIMDKPTPAPTPAHTPSAAGSAAGAVAVADKPKSKYDRSALMKKLWSNPEWRQKQMQKAADHSARMQEHWRDPAWAKRTKKTMATVRKTERLRNKMRDALMDAARRQARASGVAPLWTPKLVTSIEPTGTSIQHQSVRACAAHYGITESNMRALLKYNRAWNGIKFITVDAGK